MFHLYRIGIAGQWQIPIPVLGFFVPKMLKYQSASVLYCIFVSFGKVLASCLNQNSGLSFCQVLADCIVFFCFFEYA